MPLARWKDLCLDASDAARIGEFWSTVLGRPYEGEAGGDGRLSGALDEETIWVNQVPEPVTVKNRVHLDVNVGSRQPLLDAGATVLRPEGDDGIHWTVLQDPEGGEFCAFVRAELPSDAPAQLYEMGVDCVDPAAQAQWWGAVFGARVVDDERGFSYLLEVPGLPFDSIDFVPVPEPKSAKNRVHWDVVTEDVEALVAAGATVLRTPDSGRDDDPGAQPDGAVFWHVLADPEGNEFCAFAPRTPEATAEQDDATSPDA